MSDYLTFRISGHSRRLGNVRYEELPDITGIIRSGLPPEQQIPVLFPCRSDEAVACIPPVVPIYFPLPDLNFEYPSYEMSSTRPVPKATFDFQDFISAFADLAACMGEIAILRNPDMLDLDDLSSDHQLLILYNSLASSESIRASFSKAIADVGKSIDRPATTEFYPFEIAGRRHYAPIASLQFNDLVDHELLKDASHLKTRLALADWWEQRAAPKPQPQGASRNQSRDHAQGVERSL